MEHPWRYWHRVRKGSDDECWEWVGGQSTNGYGACLNYLSSAKKSTYAHRIAWELVNGPIPEGLTIDHLCYNKLCQNPRHLEPVPLLENLKRRRVKTHCKNGHEFSEANTRIGRHGERRCMACNREAASAFRRLHPEKNREYLQRSRLKNS